MPTEAIINIYLKALNGIVHKNPIAQSWLWELDYSYISIESFYWVSEAG